MRLAISVGLALVVLGCTCARDVSPPVAPVATPSEPAAPPPASYEVHEWGLLRGTTDDRAVLSGPHAEAPPVPLAKPVLYFHRTGEGALVVDVEARMVGGRIVEHWPSFAGEVGASVAWPGVMIQEGSCRGSRYPSLAESPCTGVTDGCEAATLATVETTDADCVFWPQPPDDDGPTLAWNHLFYRGEIAGTPPLPLRLEPQPDGTLRVTSTSAEPIPGRLVRVRRANGTAGVTDAVAIAAPPASRQSVMIPAPSDPISSGAAPLAASLREVGLTDAEIEAFRRAWDEPIFGATTTAAGGEALPTATPVASASPLGGALLAPRPTTSLVYLLPASAADALATLSFTPPPTAVRRALVVWIDER